MRDYCKLCKLLFLFACVTSSCFSYRDEYSYDRDDQEDYPYYLQDFDRSKYLAKERLGDICGQKNVKKEALKIIDMIKNASTYQGLGATLPNVFTIVGKKGMGKTLLARAIAGEAGAYIVYADSTPSLSICLQLVKERPLVVYAGDCSDCSLGEKVAFIDKHKLGSAQNRVFIVREKNLFDEPQQLPFFLWVGDMLDKEPDADVRETSVLIPMLDCEARRGLLEKFLAGVLVEDSIFCDGTLDSLAKKTSNFSGYDLESLVNEAAIIAGRDYSLNGNPSYIVCKEHIYRSYDSMKCEVQSGTFNESEDGFSYSFSEDVGFENVVGMAEVVREVKEFVDVLLDNDKYKKMGVDRQKGMLLYGPPGTGKTLLARAVAGESGCCFISVTGAQFARLYVGAGPERVRKLFKFARDMAQSRPVIIFIDEIDALGRRDDIHMGPERRNTLNQLLTEIDGFSRDGKIVVIGATNSVDLVDDALLRDGRFDKKIEVGLPVLEDRVALLKYYLGNIALDPGLSLAEIAQKYAKEFRGSSGASIESFAKKAALQAVHVGDSCVKEAHLEEAFLTTELGLKVNLQQTRQELEVTAYHEAGHALISVLLGHEVSRVSILARTKALGVMFARDKHEIFSNNSKSDLMDRIKIGLGGFCAENLIYGQSTPGAKQDLQEANRLAFEMVHRYGMGDGDLSGAVGSYAKSDKMKEKFDEATFRIVQNCLADASYMLEDNKEKLSDLTSVLLEKEMLSGQEVCDIVGGPRGVRKKR